MRITQRKGDIAKAQAIATFTRLGYDVALLLTESAPYDLLVDDGAGIHRVQVKFCGDKDGEVGLRRVHSNSKGYVTKFISAKVYDWLYVLDGNGVEYLLKDCLIGRSSVMLKMLPIMDGASAVARDSS